MRAINRTGQSVTVETLKGEKKQVNITRSFYSVIYCETIHEGYMDGKLVHILESNI